MLDNTSANATERLGSDLYEHQDDIDPLTYCLIIGVIAVVGVIGNCLNIVLFSTRRHHRQSFSVYVRAVAVSDSVVLLTTLTDDVISRLFGFHILYENRDLCPVLLFWQTLWRILSSTLLTVIAVDRYIAVVHPLHRASLCTYKRALWITGAIVLVSVVLSLPEMIWNEIETHSLSKEILQDFECPILDSMTHSLFVTLWSVLLVMLLPFCIILFLNVRCLWVVRSSLKVKFKGNSYSATASLIKVTLPIITVSISSVLFLLPILIVELIEFAFQWVYISPELQGYIDKAWDTTNVIQLLNYALNFYVFVASTEQHRATLKHVFGFGREKSSAGTFSRSQMEQSNSDIFTTTIS